MEGDRDKGDLIELNVRSWEMALSAVSGVEKRQGVAAECKSHIISCNSKGLDGSLYR